MVTQLSFQMVDGGSTPTSPLHFRLALVKKETATLAYRRWHYLGDKDFVEGFSFGAFFDGLLWGCMTFHGVSAPETCVGLFGLERQDQEGIWELGRLAFHDDAPRNSESRCLAVAMRLFRQYVPVRAIITYADTSQGHTGIIYRASNFQYLGLTAQKADFYVDGKIQERGKTHGVAGIWRPRPRKHLFVKIFDPSLCLRSEKATP